MWRFFASLLGAVLAALPVAAEPVCGKRAEVIELLYSRYTEAPAAIGVAESGGVIEILASPGGRTWTMIVTTPTGVSCLIAAGESWESIPRLAAGHGA